MQSVVLVVGLVILIVVDYRARLVHLLLFKLLPLLRKGSY